MNSSSFPNDTKHLGQYIRVSHRVGQAMSFWILTETGRVLSRSSVQALLDDELKEETVKSLIHHYDLSINHHIGDNNISVQQKVPKNALYLQDEHNILSEPFEPEV